MNNKKTLISVKNGWKVFGAGEYQVRALRGIDLEIARGEMVAIMGPSGCGKTTLLNCLATLDSMSSGEVLLDGLSLMTMKEKERDHIRASKMGFVFQSYNLIPVLTAIENVELPLLANGMKSKEARKRALEVLTRIGLKERAYHRPGELSGGQAQRVALARAIANQPQVIWADEPTGALDRETSKLVLDLFGHIHRTDQTTIILVTHDPNVAEQADRILYMDSGRIIQERLPQKKQTRTVGQGKE